MSTSLPQLTPTELSQLLAGPNPPLVLDVREPWEFALANLGGTLLPLGELSMRWKELDPERPMVALCHHGMRSAQATGFLLSQGFKDVKNLSGGIDRWSLDVDPRLPRY